MLQGLVEGMFDDAGRGDDRSPGGRGVAPVPGKPPILRRRTTWLLTVVGLVAICYGTLVPFDIDSSRTLTWRLTWHGPASGDFVANILLYIPVGLGLRMVFRRRGSSWVGQCGWSLLACAAISYLTEVMQTMVPTRVPSWTDALCNFGGSLVGISFAPLFQRTLRNGHAWLYGALRTRPFAAAAGAAALCVWTCGLFPFDVRPTPGHVKAALTRLSITPAEAGREAEGGAGLSPIQTLHKAMAAGSFGLLASLLVLAAREAGRTMTGATWYGFSRCAASAGAIEMVQLFTISHVANPRDLLAAWMCSGLGAIFGWTVATRWPATAPPARPVLRGMIGLVATALVAWATACMVLGDAIPGGRPTSWLPMVSSFDRSWNGLLGQYTTSALEYTLVAGLVAVWYRSTGRPPRVRLLLGTTLVMAGLFAAVAAVRQEVVDTAEFVLALLAGLLAFRMDRAFFGSHRPNRPGASGHEIVGDRTGLPGYNTGSQEDVVEPAHARPGQLHQLS